MFTTSALRDERDAVRRRCFAMRQQQRRRLLRAPRCLFRAYAAFLLMSRAAFCYMISRLCLQPRLLSRYAFGSLTFFHVTLPMLSPFFSPLQPATASDHHCCAAAATLIHNMPPLDVSSLPRHAYAACFQNNNRGDIYYNRYGYGRQQQNSIRLAEKGINANIWHSCCLRFSRFAIAAATPYAFSRRAS